MDQTEQYSFVWPKNQIFFGPIYLLDQNFCLDQTFILDPSFLSTINFFQNQIFLLQFCTLFFSDPKFCGNKRVLDKTFFGPQIFVNPKYYWTKVSFGPKIFWSQVFFNPKLLDQKLLLTLIEFSVRLKIWKVPVRLKIFHLAIWSSVVSLAQLATPSVALLAKLVS